MKYSWPSLLAALPFSVALWTYLFLVRLTVGRLPRLPSDLPADAIVLAFHLDLYLFHLAKCMETSRPSRLVWLGYHGFKSYLPELNIWYAGVRILRPRPTEGTRPFDAIVEFCRSSPATPFGILTDAGGPYGRVRESVPALAEATGRPVVAMRLHYTRLVRLGAHHVPLPFGKLRAEWSSAVDAATLRSLGRAAARDRLQTMIDAV